MVVVEEVEVEESAVGNVVCVFSWLLVFLNELLKNLYFIQTGKVFFFVFITPLRHQLIFVYPFVCDIFLVLFSSNIFRL